MTRAACRAEGPDGQRLCGVQIAFSPQANGRGETPTGTRKTGIRDPSPQPLTTPPTRTDRWSRCKTMSALARGTATTAATTSARTTVSERATYPLRTKCRPRSLLPLRRGARRPQSVRGFGAANHPTRLNSADDQQARPVVERREGLRTHTVDVASRRPPSPQAQGLIEATFEVSRFNESVENPSVVVLFLATTRLPSMEQLWSRARSRSQRAEPLPRSTNAPVRWRGRTTTRAAHPDTPSSHQSAKTRLQRVQRAGGRRPTGSELPLSERPDAPESMGADFIRHCDLSQQHTRPTFAPVGVRLVSAPHPSNRRRSIRPRTAATDHLRRERGLDPERWADAGVTRAGSVITLPSER